MSRGPHLTEEVKRHIAEIHLEHPDWKVAKVRERLLESEVYRLNYGPDWPSVSAVGKAMRKQERNKANRPPQTKRLDEPWNTASLDGHPIPPDTLPVVLKVWKAYVEKGRNLTIRQAKWVSRLSYVVSDTEELAETARRAALLEQLYEMTGSPFNSRGLDKRLVGLPFDYFDPLEPGANHLHPVYNIDKDGEIIDFDSPDSRERFEAKRKGGEH